MIRDLIHNLTESVRKILASGVGAIVATAFNGVAIAGGSLAGSTPASTYVQFGTVGFATGAGAPTSVDLPVGSFFYNSSSATLYYKWGAAVSNWSLLQVNGAAASFTSLSLSSFIFSTSYFQLVNMAAPSGVAGRLTLYSKDVGGGKVGFFIKCGTAAEQQIGISEP